MIKTPNLAVILNYIPRWTYNMYASLQIPKRPNRSMIHQRRRLTRQPREETLLRTLAIQIRQKIIINAFAVRLGEAALGLEIRVAEVMAHAALQEVESSRVVLGVTAAVVAPVQGRRFLRCLRGEERGECDAEEKLVGGAHVGCERGHGESAAGGDDVDREVDHVRGVPADVGGRWRDELYGEVGDLAGAAGGLQDLENGRSWVWGVGGVRDHGAVNGACEEESDREREEGRHFDIFYFDTRATVGGTCRKSCAVCVCVEVRDSAAAIYTMGKNNCTLPCIYCDNQGPVEADIRHRRNLICPETPFPPRSSAPNTANRRPRMQSLFQPIVHSAISRSRGRSRLGGASLAKAATIGYRQSTIYFLFLGRVFEPCGSSP